MQWPVQERMIVDSTHSEPLVDCKVAGHNPHSKEDRSSFLCLRVPISKSQQLLCSLACGKRISTCHTCDQLSITLSLSASGGSAVDGCACEIQGNTGTSVGRGKVADRLVAGLSSLVPCDADSGIMRQLKPMSLMAVVAQEKGGQNCGGD